MVILLKLTKVELVNYTSLVGLLLSKRKRHDNILAAKAIVEKPTFFKCFFVKYFRQRLLSLVRLRVVPHFSSRALAFRTLYYP